MNARLPDKPEESGVGRGFVFGFLCSVPLWIVLFFLGKCVAEGAQ